MKLFCLCTLIFQLFVNSEMTSVLFIGNSLTSKNNLPIMFKNLANKAGSKNVLVSSRTPPAATLGSHVQLYFSTSLILSRNWSVVVLQDQSESLARNIYEAQKKVFPPALILSNAAKQVGPKVVLYETMAHYSGTISCIFSKETNCYELMQKEIIYEYEMLRKYLGSETAHVGSSFLLYKQRNITGFDTLYSDNVHPTKKGTFIAACSIYASLFGRRELLNLKMISKNLPGGIRPKFANIVKSLVNYTMKI